MAPHEEGGTAFPNMRNRHDPPGCLIPTPGMTLRDWYTGLLASGLLAAEGLPADPDAAAIGCWTFADSLIAHRDD